MNDIQLQVRSTDKGYQIIITKDFKLLWDTPYIFKYKKDALDFIKTHEKMILKLYENYKWEQLRQEIERMSDGEQKE